MRGSKILIMIFGLMLSASALAQASSTSQNDIVVKSKEFQQGKLLANATKQSVSTGSTDGLTQHQLKQAAAPRTRQLDSVARNSDPDFWIYDALVSFNVDNDYDGYYSTFTLEFDADTYFDTAEVYARLYLSTGEVFEEYHTTSLFYIHGDSSNDALVVESELLTGFPTGDYELLIELYDGVTDQLVAVYDGYNDADLTLLTLESGSYEHSTVVITTEHGGAFGALMLLLLPVALLRKKRV